MSSILRRSAQGCSLLLILLGTVVLLGWTFRVEALMSVMPHYVTMKPNTAIGFLTSGIGLLLALSGSGRSLQLSGRTLLLSRAWSALTLLNGGLALVEYGLRIDLHIDQLLFRDPVQHADPGRMSLITSVLFFIAGLSLLLVRGNSAARRVSQLLGLLLAGLSLAGVVGYLYGVSVLYGSFNNVNSMAFHTGVGFLVLSCGLVLAQPDSTFDQLLSSTERGGWLTRRMLPFLIVLPVLLGYLYLRPAVNLGQLHFGMALFAVTLALGGALALIPIGLSLNRSERQQRKVMQVSVAAAAAAELSERELRLVTDHLPTLIAYIDAEERYVRVNRTYEEWLGPSAERIAGRSVREVLGDAYYERTRETRENARRGVTSSVETLYPTIHGERCALVTYVPDLDERGRFRGFVSMVIDVDDQRRAETALRQSEKLAAVGRLSSTIAHEINNPVDAAMNLIYLAREQTTDEGMRSLLEIADSELKRVVDIVSETLRFHKQAELPQAVLAGNLLNSVLILHNRKLRNGRIEVERRERAHEPFSCFEGEIRQVLNNLIANAIDALLPGGRLLLRSRPAVEWGTGRRGIALTIADTGNGMSERTRARIFEAFFTTKGIGGTGLGLWISSEILARHGGTMRIRTSQNAVRHGSVFVVFLPLTVALDARDQPSGA